MPCWIEWVFISRYHDASMRLAVCAKCRAFAFPLWTTLRDNTGTLIIHSSSIHSASTHHPHIIHTWTHSRDTSTGHSKCTYICTTRTHTIYSLLPVRPVFECSLARPWHVLSKNLCASSLVFMRAPRLSVNYFNFYSKKACM